MILIDNSLNIDVSVEMEAIDDELDVSEINSPGEQSFSSNNLKIMEYIPINPGNNDKTSKKRKTREKKISDLPKSNIKKKRKAKANLSFDDTVEQNIWTTDMEPLNPVVAMQQEVQAKGIYQKETSSSLTNVDKILDMTGICYLYNNKLI
jgi:hypothetical protein